MKRKSKGGKFQTLSLQVDDVIEESINEESIIDTTSMSGSHPNPFDSRRSSASPQKSRASTK